MLPDAAHAGRRTTLEMVELSDGPIIFSHVACAAVYSHFRNVDDEQIRACAARGGVIGITGNNNYLGDVPTIETLFRHVDHVVEIAGPERVGLGIDYVDDTAALNAFVAGRPEEWAGHWEPFAFATPEQFLGLTERMLSAGYPDDSVRGILGGNFRRVCAAVWK
jgi:membrane dipeptidase